jgi:hypothetical protein
MQGSEKQDARIGGSWALIFKSQIDYINIV